MTEVQIHVEVFLNDCWKENRTKETNTVQDYIIY
jgi:hypothetical protein